MHDFVECVTNSMYLLLALGLSVADNDDDMELNGYDDFSDDAGNAIHSCTVYPTHTSTCHFSNPYCLFAGCRFSLLR